MLKKTKVAMLAGSLMALSACGGASLGIPGVQSALLPNGDSASNAPAPTITPNDESFGRLMNSYRDSVGVDAVAHDSRLDQAAQAHAEDMAENNYFSHTGRNGSTALDRIRATGYDPNAYGENIAGRQQTESEALDAWINSRDHDRVLRADSFEDFGLGVAGQGSRTRWVLIMGREKSD
ncbi:CAP domain-containing protein [Yoonia sp. 208BN28-4]|uniref:CAP domain-containing protein n=1 Tax=Yoonia sp. 208BN28-4 TaxID=3126505 RepID=UPI0030B49117